MDTLEWNKPRYDAFLRNWRKEVRQKSGRDRAAAAIGDRGSVNEYRKAAEVALNERKACLKFLDDVPHK